MGICPGLPAPAPGDPSGDVHAPQGGLAVGRSEAEGWCQPISLPPSEEEHVSKGSGAHGGCWNWRGQGTRVLLPSGSLSCPISGWDGAGVSPGCSHIFQGRCCSCGAEILVSLSSLEAAADCWGSWVKDFVAAPFVAVTIF